MVEPTPTKRAVIDIGRACNIRCIFCFVNEEGRRKPKIYTKAGVKSMDKVSKGEEILTIDEKTGKLVWTKVVDILSGITEEFFKIKTRSGKMFRVTGEHPFYVVNQGWVSAKDLQISDDLLYIRESEAMSFCVSFRMKENFYNKIGWECLCLDVKNRKKEKELLQMEVRNFISNGDEIVSIQKIKQSKPTINFSCAPYNTFLANNILVHNCYHKHTPYEGIKSLVDLKREVDQACDRGNTYIDFTGGEPTLVPHLPEVIDYIGSKGMKCCVITNGIAHPNKIQNIISAGVDDWLVSVHGMNGTHDKLTANKGGFSKLISTLDLISNEMDFRFNVVINKYNTTELLEISALAAGYNVRIVNFINFNPHHAWRNRLEETYEFIADLRQVQPILESSIDYLENENRGVNVRYYPMCRIREDLRRVICNDLQVGFDPYEWDYEIQPKTFQEFRNWCQRNSNLTEHKGLPCSYCDLGEICGGINRYFNVATKGVVIDPVTNFEGDKSDFYWYRRNNDVTLQER